MRIRFGYVAITLNLEDASTSKTISLTNLQKLKTNEQKLLRLKRIVKENLNNLLRIIRYNIDEKIHVYRITSKLIPFSTYPLDFDWDYLNLFTEEFETLGKVIKASNIRLSAHPDHFTVINSPDDKVFMDSSKDLEYHDKIFSAMGLDYTYKLVIHLGGFYGNKNEAIKRFIYNFNRLPEGVKARVVLENDDKIYTVEEVLKVCQELNIPMVLDIHHHYCNRSGNIIDYLPDIWVTWGNNLPKIHVSSPKNNEKQRYHADYVKASDVMDFLISIAPLKKDFDIMVEAKMKDKAMFNLIKDLTEYQSVKVLDPTTIETI